MKKNNLLLRIIGFLLLSAAISHAQINVAIRMNNSQFLAGESLLVGLNITNNSGNNLELHNVQRVKWVDFVIKKDGGQPAIPRGNNSFGSVKIINGQSMNRAFDIASMYNLKEAGNYSVSVIIRPNRDVKSGYVSNRILFSVSNARPDWSQKVGVPGKPGITREYRVTNFTNPRRSQLYIQVIDCKSGVSIKTQPLGEALLFRKPQAAVDKMQNLYVLYLANPQFYVLARVDINGNLINRELFSRGSGGDPRLISFGDGSVKVAGGIPYNAKAVATQKAKTRKMSDRPAYTFSQ
jgi:hypothetical protein